MCRNIKVSGKGRVLQLIPRSIKDLARLNFFSVFLLQFSNFSILFFFSRKMTVIKNDRGSVLHM